MNKMEDTIVLYPSPGAGHIISMIELAKLIIHHKHNSNLSLTILLTTGFLGTPLSLSYIDSISNSYPSITFRHLPPIPAAAVSPTRSHATVAFDFFRRHLPHVRHALECILKTHCIRAFIIDLFCSSALVVGRELHIPVFYFYTSGAAALAAFLQLPRFHRETNTSFKDMKSTVFYFRGLPPLKATQMPEPVLDREDPSTEEFISFCSYMPLSDGIIVNTFADLEPMAIKAIEDGLCSENGESPSIYCTGPLIASYGGDGGDGVENECLAWLDKQPCRSVVYLCFGSRGTFSASQVEEIANGLEKSGHRFLWVVKRPLKDRKIKYTEYAQEFDLDSVLPRGFIGRTKDRGMVLKLWAPQVPILNHNSIGVFVTHCGWNSVLEAVQAGVPMVAWPLHAEQHLNRNCLVQEMKLAVGVEGREEDGFVTAIELERRVSVLMESERGEEVRERCWSMRDKALAAMGEDGSSTKALRTLFQTWKLS